MKLKLKTFLTNLLSRFRRKKTNRERVIILSRKPISIIKLREELIKYHMIPDDGIRPQDIVEINSVAVWESFKKIYEKNERLSVKHGHFSFYIEEDHVLTQLFDVNSKALQAMIDGYCRKFGCVAIFDTERANDARGTVLNKVTVKHNFFSRERIIPIMHYGKG